MGQVPLNIGGTNGCRNCPWGEDSFGGYGLNDNATAAVLDDFRPDGRGARECRCSGEPWTCSNDAYATVANFTVGGSIEDFGDLSTDEGQFAMYEFVTAFEADLELQLGVTGGVKVFALRPGSIVVDFGMTDEAVPVLTQMQGNGELTEVAGFSLETVVVAGVVIEAPSSELDGLMSDVVVGDLFGPELRAKGLG